MKKIVVLMCSCFLLVACANKSNTVSEAEVTMETATDMHNAENALDVAGLYKGVFPAADCPGINVTLTLNKDKTFMCHYDYIDRPGSAFDEVGTYSINQNILTTTPKEGSASTYKIKENQLVHLDADNKEIEGPLAEYYILTKE